MIWNKIGPIGQQWNKEDIAASTRVQVTNRKVSQTTIYDMSVQSTHFTNKIDEILNSIRDYEHLEELCYDDSRTNYFDEIEGYDIWIRMMPHIDDYNIYIKFYPKPSKTP